MQSYFIADRTINNLTMVVSVGGAPTTQGCVVSYRPFHAFSFLDIKSMKLPTVSNKKLDGIIRRQTQNKKQRAHWRATYVNPFGPLASVPRNAQCFSKKSTQFILRNIGPEISFSTAKEVLGQPVRKGKFVIWPTASFEQEIVMAAIDQCHDRCNGAIYNGIITIGHQEIKIKDYLRRAE